jgi:hypothetical protein
MALPSRVWCCVAVQVVCAVHKRLEVNVLAVEIHCDESHMVSAVHTRLLDFVASVLSNCAL